MSASDKIEEAKNCFQKIKKSGRNNYQKYDYFETKDIFPLVRKVCDKYNLKTNIKPMLDKPWFVLTITDKDDNSSEEFYVPYAQLGAGDAGKFMQDFGRCQTYAMRYLYIQAFEIAVPDEIDNKDQNKKIVPKPKKQPKPVKQVKKPIKKIEPTEEEPTEPDEVTNERVQEILDEAYMTVTIDAGKEFNLATALWTIKKLCRSDAELEAVKASLDTYTADKVKQK